MFCPKCGNQVAEGMKFCNACGARLAENQPVQRENPIPPEPVYQQPAQPTYQQPVYQQPVQPIYQQPAQQVYQPPVQQGYPQTTVYAPQVYVPVSQPQPQEKEEPGNGPAIAGMVFGCMTFATLLIMLFVINAAIKGAGGYYSDSAEGLIIGGAAGGLVGFFIAGFLALFHFIFGLIGFIKGLKNGAKRVIAIIGFVLFFVNVLLFIVCIARYAAMINAFSYMSY